MAVLGARVTSEPYKTGFPSMSDLIGSRSARQGRLAPVSRLLLASALTCTLAPLMAAESGGTLGIELNKLESREGTCRPYLVFRNETDGRFEALALELVLFDTEGFILKRFSLDAAPLAPGKTSVKLFEIDGVRCETLGRILVNEVAACADHAGSIDACLERIRLSSRLSVDLFK